MTSCLLCAQKTLFKSTICDFCTSILPLNTHPCRRCGSPLVNQTTAASDTFCEDCFANPPPYIQCVSPFLYHFPVDQLIAKMKYLNRPQLSKVLVELMIWQLNQNPIPQSALPEALIPIPMHRKKQRQRGYNQSVYLAKHLGKHFNVPVITQGLLKNQATESQRSLKAIKRHQNLENSFALNTRLQHKLSQLDHVALIDDVITTGATATAASLCLQNAGVSDIEIWAIARTP